jgi:hypothetical protein
MIYAGLLSLLQILFLPGLILNSFNEKESGILYRICYIVAFSMLINLALVVLLVSIHTYLFSVIFAIIIIELVVIVFLYRKQLSTPIGNLIIPAFTKIRSYVLHYFDEQTENKSSKNFMQFIKAFGLLLALITLGWVTYEFISQIGTVFSKWDAVVSYNKWATEWSRGLFPTGACEYPQLLTTNWSLTYIITKSTIGIFSKLVQSVFPILFVMAMIDIGLTFKSGGFLFGVPISIFLLKKFAGTSLFEGYMDVAVTTFILLSFYMILKDYYNERFSRKTLWLSGVVILAAAMTKQPGILAFFAWVLVNLFIVLSKNPGRIWASLRKILFPTLVFLLLIISWYLFKINRDLLVQEPSCYALTNSWAVNDFKVGYLKILITRLQMLGFWVLLIPMFLFSIAFSKKVIRLIFLFFGLPYLLISLSYGSLDAFIRYLTPITFVFAFSASLLIDLLIKLLLKVVDIFPVDKFLVGFNKITKLVVGLFIKIPKILLWGIIILGLVIIALLGSRFPDSKLTRNSTYQQMGIGNRLVNNYLVDFYKDKDRALTTLTWYPFIKYLPGMEDRAYVYFEGSVSELESLLNHEDINYILLYNTTPVDLSDFIKDLEKNGQLKFITDFGTKNDASFYEFVR